MYMDIARFTDILDSKFYYNYFNIFDGHFTKECTKFQASGRPPQWPVPHVHIPSGVASSTYWTSQQREYEYTRVEHAHTCTCNVSKPKYMCADLNIESGGSAVDAEQAWISE